MKIYTKTGDDGSTGLLGGKRVSKSDPRIGCTGTIDEVNAAIGLSVIAAPDEIRHRLRRIQNELFVIGSHLAQPGSSQSLPGWTSRLSWRWNVKSTPPKISFRRCETSFCRAGRSISRRSGIPGWSSGRRWPGNMATAEQPSRGPAVRTTRGPSACSWTAPNQVYASDAANAATRIQ